MDVVPASPGPRMACHHSFSPFPGRVMFPKTPNLTPVYAPALFLRRPETFTDPNSWAAVTASEMSKTCQALIARSAPWEGAPYLLILRRIFLRR